MKVLRILLKRNSLWVLLASALAIISNLSQMIFAYFIGELVNRIETRTLISFYFVGICALLMASNAFTLLLYQYVGRLAAEKMAHSLRMGYAKKLLYSAREIGKCDVASAMSVAQNELAFANNYLGNTFFDITGMLFMGVLATFFLLFQNIILTLVIIIPTLLILLYVYFSSQRLSGIVSAAQNEKNRMNKVAYYIVNAHPALKIFSGEKFAVNSYMEHFANWKKQWEKTGRLSALYNTLSGILSRLPLLLLLLIGSFMVIKGEIPMGTLIVFLYLQKSLTQSIMNLPNWIANFKVFTTDLGRIDIV